MADHKRWNATAPRRVWTRFMRRLGFLPEDYLARAQRCWQREADYDRSGWELSICDQRREIEGLRHALRVSEQRFETLAKAYAGALSLKPPAPIIVPQKASAPKG